MQQVLKVLELDNVIKRYDNGVVALGGLTFHVPSGSIFGFICLNGAGKTSTIRIIAGLSRKDFGKIRIFGKEMEYLENSYKGSVGFVLDEPLYFDWMSAKEYLQFVGKMYGLSSDESEYRTNELLDFFNLIDTEKNPIRTFSTGMKKKFHLLLRSFINHDFSYSMNRWKV
ncbi:MAG: ABC transporter ATP-binding protein [Ignavibacteriae bacterium]|nr:ABC transporter ATP-binding protein [Ignavibacteriota bacterium]